MPDLFSGATNESEFPTTRYICFLLERDRSRIEATRESRRLHLRDEVGRYYWENVRRR